MVVVVVAVAVPVRIVVHVAVAVHPVVVLLSVPAVRAAATRVHEEVGDGGELEAQLLGDGELHLLGGAPVLPENGYQGAALQVGEDQPLLLGHLVAFPSSVLLLPFTCCGEEQATWQDYRE